MPYFPCHSRRKWLEIYAYIRSNAVSFIFNCNSIDGQGGRLLNGPNEG